MSNLDQKASVQELQCTVARLTREIAELERVLYHECMPKSPYEALREEVSQQAIEIDSLRQMLREQQWMLGRFYRFADETQVLSFQQKEVSTEAVNRAFRRVVEGHVTESGGTFYDESSPSSERCRCSECVALRE